MQVDHQGESGFSLVEVLVALAIAAISLTALYGSLIQSMKGSSALESRFAATILARSLLEDAGQSTIKGRFQREGRQGDLEWRLTGEPTTLNPTALTRIGFVLYEVTAEISSPKNGTFALSTRVLGR